MPTIAIVEGVKVQLFALEHPPPHFQLVLAEHRAVIEISSLRLIEGYLPPAKLAVVLSWAETRREALLAAWNAIAAGRRPDRIG